VNNISNNRLKGQDKDVFIGEEFRNCWITQADIGNVGDSNITADFVAYCVWYSVYTSDEVIRMVNYKLCARRIEGSEIITG